MNENLEKEMRGFMGEIADALAYTEG